MGKAELIPALMELISYQGIQTSEESMHNDWMNLSCDKSHKEKYNMPWEHPGIQLSLCGRSGMLRTQERGRAWGR